MTDLLLKTLSDGVLTLTLGNGRAHALSHRLINALHTAITQAARDPQTRVIVIEGPGHIFCAGHDLKEIARHRADPDHGRAYLTALFEDCATLMLAITHCRTPTIAMVDGIATAAGLQLVAACDLAYASDRATFCLPGVNNGGFCTTPAVAVSRAIGRKHLMDLLLTGQTRDAAWALRAGLVNEVLPANTLRDHVFSTAHTLAGRNPGPIADGKTCTIAHLDQDLATAYAMATTTMIGHFMDPGRLEHERKSRFTDL
ncbi:enoyl-CoA hydratase-related protein [Pararhodobacter sp.]|uniref:enoyl-CoA hydratase-related protein n=1 Tax=Pararhodobacter sp. TaxID=2127056 RepID=UPI002AFF161A|nr:enoyl-CoA hydratase-related protein [Pararhodobacter sp.]